MSYRREKKNEKNEKKERQPWPAGGDGGFCTQTNGQMCMTRKLISNGTVQNALSWSVLIAPVLGAPQEHDV
jgi:hypothetical protein